MLQPTILNITGEYIQSIVYLLLAALVVDRIDFVVYLLVGCLEIRGRR